MILNSDMDDFNVDGFSCKSFPVPTSINLLLQWVSQISKVLQFLKVINTSTVVEPSNIDFLKIFTSHSI